MKITISRADICEQAAKVIETRGYCRALCSGIKVDVIGAIGVVLYGTPIYVSTGLSAAVEDAIAAQAGVPGVANWATLPGNTKRKAIRLLRATAAGLRAAGNDTPTTPGDRHVIRPALDATGDTR